MKYLAPLLLIVLVGCVSPPAPETMRQKLAAAELSYQGALQTIQSLQQSGLIVKGSNTARRVITAVKTANAGLVQWRAQVDSPAAQTGALAALSSLSTLIAELQHE